MMFYKETNFKETPIGKVPKDWEVMRATDVAEYINGYPFSPEDWKTSGIPIIRIQNLNDPNAEFNFFDGEIDEIYKVKNGDLLFSWSASIGVYIWKRGDAVLNQHIFKVIPKPKVNKLFLYYALFLAIEQLKRRVHGSTMKHFRRGELKTTFLPFPSPPEQQAIAELLSIVDEAIQKTDEIIAKTERLKMGLMQELLTKGIGHKEFKDTEIGRIPKKWEVVRLGDILEICQYGLSIPMNEKGKYPIIRMDELVNGYVIPEITKYVDLDEETFKNFRLEKGDILFNRTNAPDLVGRTGIFLLEGDYVFASYLIRLRPKPKMFDPRFLTFYLVFSEDRLRRLATRAVHQANINATNLKRVKVPRPAIEEQQKIADIISSADKKLEIEKNEKAKLERIKQGLMNLLLTGKIRVKV
jgi:type I restriction enzyme S subunit